MCPWLLAPPRLTLGAGVQRWGLAALVEFALQDRKWRCAAQSACLSGPGK